MQKNTSYAVLETSAKEYTQNSSQKGSRLVAINLKTGEIQSELASKTVIDFVMVPNGRYVLVQYNLIQSDGSVKRKWTSFDLQTKEEKNLEKLENKNLEIDTSNFIDTTHIAVGGKVNNEEDYEALYYIDISTGKTKEYAEYGNVTSEWNCDYSVKKKTAVKLNPPEELRYTLQVYFSQKENALLFTNEKEVYLVNLEK